MARTTAAQKAAAVATVAEALGVDPEALAALVAQKPSPTAKAKVEAKPAAKPLSDTLKDDLIALGYDFTTGRTYVSKASVEAQARALGKKVAGFEVVQSEKSGARTAAVVIVRDETGKVYVQNLRTV